MKPPALSNVLVVTVLLAFVVVWIVVYGVAAALMYWPKSGEFDQQLRIFANALAKLGEEHMAPSVLQRSLSGVTFVVDELAGADNHPDAVSFNLWDDAGKWMAGSSNAPRGPVETPDAEGFFDAEFNGETYRVFSRWTDDRSIRVDVMQSETSRRKNLNSVMLTPVSIVAPLLVVLPLLLLPILFVVRCGLKPLRELSNELSAREPGDLTPIQMGDLVSELRPVVDEVNGTLKRLDELLKRERDFLADAAHELRTPLAVVNVQADEVMRATSPGERADAASNLKAGLNRANRLVGQLLELARMEAGADVHFADADVADIVRECLAMYAAEARQRSIELVYRGPDHLPVKEVGHAFESIVGNLVANAIRYGREDGQVVVTVEPTPQDGWTLAVCDDGPGVPPGDRARMFERFRRGSQLGISGSGLGLAIVASAARQIGGRLDTANGLGGCGLCVRLTWPEGRAGIDARVINRA